ncbi:MAG: restriction endonuclease [Microcystaceae cyanobacterium]
MTIPDFQTIMLPLLKYTGDKQEHSLRETIEYLADSFHLSDAERRQLLPSGQQPTFDNRVGWARTHLKKAGLIETTRRGYCKITNRGLDVLQQSLLEINVDFLNQYQEFRAFKTSKKSKDHTITANEVIHDSKTPEEQLEQAFQKIKDDLKDELLENLQKCSPSFFEKLVIDLLIRMGYGGSRKEAGQAIGKSNDGGIDGIIKEDRLGLDIIYIQAKRWTGTVGRPEIQKFAGALLGQQAKKGIFITTSQYSKEATEYASMIDSKIILIDGSLLSEFLIDYNVGVSPVKSYEIKKIDIDYFSE